MKFLDLRKYFFAYLYIFLGITAIISSIAADIFLEPAPTYITHEPMPPMVRNGTYTMIYIASLLLYICCCGALIIEIFLRFVIKKLFPNLKFPFTINIPNKLNKFLSIIFYILFILGSWPILLVIISSIFIK